MAFDITKYANFLVEAPSLMSIKSQGMTSKMWILPDGSLEPVVCHHIWMNKHKEELVSVWGLDPAEVERHINDQDEQDMRLLLLRHGFFRVNYTHRNGALTIEGNIDHWTSNIKDTYFMLVAANIKDLYFIRVFLMDDAGKVVRSGEEQIFQYPSEEKLDHLPLLEGRRLF